MENKMEKKKIIFIPNHFQYSDGTSRALIGIVNNLDLEKFDITIKPIYKCDFNLKSELKKDIKLEKTFGFYFKGFNKIVKKIPIKFLYKKIINKKYDIEVAFQCDLPTMLVGASLNDKAVHVEWMHCYDLWPKQYKIADKVVCVSKYCEEKTRKEMNGNVNVTTCYNPIDDSRVLTLAQDSTSQENEYSTVTKPLFVTVGRLSPEKGYIRLVKIMKELSDEGFSFSLVIIGGGPEEKRMREEIQNNNMQDKIFMTGAKKNPHNITSQADCFICSSFNEGYSTACTEAAILGIPIITTCVPGGKEIIDDCECGILTELDDESLKNGIREVLVNPSILDKWKETLSITKNKFGLENRKKEMKIIFDEFYQLAEKKVN